MVLADYHVHTNWSHGRQTVEQAAERAKELGLEAIAITDHARKGSIWVPEYASHLETTKKRVSTPLIISVLEVKVLDHDGQIDLNPEWINGLDMVLVAVHNIPGITREKIDALSDRLPHLYAELLISAIKNVELPVPTIMAHPGKWLLENNLAFIPKDYWDEIAKTAKRHKKIIEYNTSCPLPENFLEILLSNDVKFSVGSDAHCADEIGKGIPSATKLVGRSLVKPWELTGNGKA